MHVPVAHLGVGNVHDIRSMSIDSRPGQIILCVHVRKVVEAINSPDPKENQSTRVRACVPSLKVADNWHRINWPVEGRHTPDHMAYTAASDLRRRPVASRMRTEDGSVRIAPVGTR